LEEKTLPKLIADELKVETLSTIHGAKRKNGRCKSSVGHHGQVPWKEITPWRAKEKKISFVRTYVKRLLKR
jgi:hypothetical protein